MLASTQAKILRTTTPIRITPAGQQIIAEIGFESVYPSNAQRILAQVKEKLRNRANITDLDIEQVSLQVGAELFDNNDAVIESAKKYLFEHPQMLVSDLKVLIGIYIRDKIIQDENVKREIQSR